MPGARLGTQAVFEGEEICEAGKIRLTEIRVNEEKTLRGLDETEWKTFETQARWIEGRIQRIMDAREPQLIIICVHDDRLCDICREKCGEIGYGWTDFRERMGGPPFHDNCRCYLMETGGYGTYLFEGKTVSEEDLNELNKIRTVQERLIVKWGEYFAAERVAIVKETQNFIDNYFANCRVYVNWYEVDCTKKMGLPCEGEKGTEMNLREKGCMPPYANQTCWPEYIGYNVIEICTGWR